MDFKRKKKRGESQKVRRYWFSEEKYRIVWRCEVHGVQVVPRYQACVRTIIPNYSGIEGQSFEMWDFTDSKHRLFKVLGKAQESCERHHRLWERACEATGVRGLIEIFGNLPSGIPLWARKKLPRKLYEILSRPRSVKYRDEEEECEPDHNDPTRTSACSALPTDVTPAGPIPALPAEVKDGSEKSKNQATGSKTRRAKRTPAAPSAEETAKAPKKRAVKRTKKPSKRTGRKTPSTRGSSTSGDKPSKGSVKKKSKPSKS